MSDSYTTILDDLPAERDALNFQPYIDTIADIVTSPKTRTPLTIGIFGTWGSGKTSLMRLVQKQLPKSYRTAWFDAWKYERETDLWRALLLHVLLALREALPKDDANAEKDLGNLETALYRAVDREELGGVQIDWGKLAGGVAQGALQIGLSFVPGVNVLTEMVEELQKEGATTATEKLVESIGRERSRLFIEQVRFLEQFQRKFRELVQTYIVERNLRLVVFIDDLDRCMPEKAVEVLEAIKLFLDVPGCLFILGLDDKVIARGVEIKYRQLGLSDGDEARRERLVEGTRYLEKIIQLPFQLPPIERRKMADFIKNLVSDWADPECARVFAAGLVDNPRQVKRAVNTYLLLTALAEKTEADIRPVQLAKIIALQSALPPLYDFLKEDNHRYLKDLEGYFLAQTGAGEMREILPKKETAKARPETRDLPEALAPFLRRRGIAAVRRVLTLHPDKPEYNFSPLRPAQLRSYFTLTRRAEAPELESQAAPPRADFEPRTVPPRADFEPELVRIPAGPFLMGTQEDDIPALMKKYGGGREWYEREIPQHKVNLPEYWIGKYPVTNRQYQVFIQESDHRPPSHWDGDQYPEGKADHPVVKVSWRDALAYCNWLREKTGKPYTLPSEAEWEKAARGPLPSTETSFQSPSPLGRGSGGEGGGRIYPWGDEWDSGRCNSEESGIGDTTPVGQYSPQGDSPYGCADMAGNVWEWTRSLYEKYPYNADDGRENLDAPDDAARVLRGGSWYFDRWNVRAAFRRRGTPNLFGVNFGFRVVLSPAKSGGGAAPLHPAPARQSLPSS